MHRFDEYITTRESFLVRFCLLHFNDACEHQSVELSVDEHLGIHQENEAFSVGVH